MELRASALRALSLCDVEAKLVAVAQLAKQADAMDLDRLGSLAEPEGLPGRPQKPLLVEARLVPKRSSGTPEGLAHLVHALCHIEFNAINLALDAVWRFAHMPDAYYRDWMQVAAEEADHFELLRTELVRQGFRYGDFNAHDGLWDMCRKTAADPTARMALVPRTLEARGLDATPVIQQKLRQSRQPDALLVADLLDIILRDEVGHVRMGNHWYQWCCHHAGLDPVSHFQALLVQFQAPHIKGPMNVTARLSAGFALSELDILARA